VSFRARVLVAIAAGSLVVAGGLALQREFGPRSSVSSAAAAVPISGARFCPHGGGEGWRVWVVVANPANEPVQVRVAARLGSSLPTVTPAVIEPRTHRYFEVPASQMAAATTVEFFGAPVAAAMVAARPGGGVAAEPCAGNPDVRWHVPEASTLRGEESYLVVHNPFSAESVVDVAIFAGQQLIRPGRLQGVVLAPGEVKALPVHAFALGEPAVAATVSAPLGRVVVAGVGVSRGGIRSVLAAHEPGLRWILPGDGAPAAGTVLVTAPQAQAPFRVTAAGAAGEQALLDLESVAAGTARAFDIAAPGASVVVEGDGRAPLLAGRRLLAEEPPPAPGPAPKGPGPKGGAAGKGKGGAPQKPKAPPPPPVPGDLASSRGVSLVPSSLVALPAVSPDGGPGILLVTNPSTEERAVTVTFLGTAGPPPPPTDVSVPPGTTMTLPLPGGPPTAALVETEHGGIVAAQVATAPTAYAISVGVPIRIG
jgi:hypothetical protein